MYVLYFTYSQQHLRLYKTVKLPQNIFNLIHFYMKHRFDWEYLTVCTNLSCCCPYLRSAATLPVASGPQWSELVRDIVSVNSVYVCVARARFVYRLTSVTIYILSVGHKPLTSSLKPVTFNNRSL
jgi:hypothetical protein